jgi:hypothetical protein
MLKHAHVFSLTAEALLTARKTDLDEHAVSSGCRSVGLETAAEVVPMLIPGARSH